MGSRSGGGAPEPEVLRWTAWPARGKPWSAVVLVAGAVVLGVLIARGTGDRLLAIAAPLFVLASLGSFLFPTDYRLTREAVEIRSLGVARVRPWSEVRRIVADPAGILLSPFAERSWLDSYRGLRLLTGGNRDQVLAFVEARLAEVREAGGGGPGAGDGAAAGGPSAAAGAADGGRARGPGSAPGAAERDTGPASGGPDARG